MPINSLKYYICKIIINNKKKPKYTKVNLYTTICSFPFHNITITLPFHICLIRQRDFLPVNLGANFFAPIEFENLLSRTIPDGIVCCIKKKSRISLFFC